MGCVCVVVSGSLIIERDARAEQSEAYTCTGKLRGHVHPVRLEPHEGAEARPKTCDEGTPKVIRP